MITFIKKTYWLYNKAKISLQVHKYPLRIVNYKVIMVIKLPNLFNPLLEIFKGPRYDMSRPSDAVVTTHASKFKWNRHTKHTH